jgi:lysyl-tRNA synthetase class 2
MANLDEIRQGNIQKIAKLNAKGISAYPAESRRDMSLADAIEKFDSLAGKEIYVVGRVMSLRAQGALVFFHLYDGTGKFQGLIRRDDIGDEAFSFFTDIVGIGDFLEIHGTLFLTKRGEKTVQLTGWKMLSKNIRPLPEKWHGIQDEEDKLRKRYLDILFNEDVRDMFKKRAIFWSAMRQFLRDRDFMEVETPALENMAGGADAKPFITHHNALDIDVFLRISVGELWQKRLMVAGFTKTFEIGRIFRNEGIDPEHGQDYTAMEFYMAYADYNQGMKLVEEMYKFVIEKTFDTLQFAIRGFDVDFSKEWIHYDYVSTIKEKTGIDVMTASLEDIENKLISLKVDFDKNGWNMTRAMDNLWKYCRKQISGPGFLVNVPVSMEPLAKRKADDTRFVERFQILIAGSEIGKGFSELNDPIDQAGRFAEQAKLREAGDEEAQMNDTDFVEALEYGMPPTFGFGTSERLFSFLCGKPLRECQIFPLLRPKKPSASGEDNKIQEKTE